MPGFESGFVWEARGFLASEGKDCWEAFADCSERVVPFASEPDIAMVTVARDSLSEPGWVKVRTAMIGGVC